LLSTFGLVFIAEFGDKTQLAVVMQTCKYRSAWPVFLGASLSLTAVTALGAVGGQVLGLLIPEAALRIGAALALVVMGGLIWREATQSDSADALSDVDCEYDAQCNSRPRPRWDWKAFGSTLTLLFVAELGDKTQLAVMGLASKQPQPGVVFVGGALALIAVTALGVIGGQQLGRWIPQRLLLRISAAAFVVMGVLMGLGVL
jgi:putative Ca2+/H+ antiporter (TMEM165/GDT1 family)